MVRPVLLPSVLAQLLGGSLVAAGPPVTPPSAGAAACPAEMRLVEGVHHDQVQRLCQDFRGGRCWSFFPGAVGLERTVTPVRVCMDRYEWPNRAGERPAVMVNFNEAETSCRSAGKRLCTEYEWETACEGPELKPWPYGHRFVETACNASKPYMPVSEAKLLAAEPVRSRESARVWQGAASGAFPACSSDAGVVDLVGNVEEWVVTSRPEWAFKSSLKGGFWSKPWAGCRGTNDSHGPMFRFYEVGFRCCKDPAQR
jgi:hypothetical protein